MGCGHPDHRSGSHGSSHLTFSLDGDGNPNNEYWLADLRAISVAKVVVSGDGACNMYDPVLSDEENIEELEDRYDMSMHVEHRALAFFN